MLLAAGLTGKAMGMPERDGAVWKIVLDELPLLFADDSGVAECSGMTRTLHPARTRAEPVLQASKPWEGERVYVYGTVMRDEFSGGYRLWYMGNAEKTNAADRTPTLRGSVNTFVLFATSPDGVAWVKPKLGLHAFNGSADNNIVYDLASASVIFDTFERDPRRRYKMLGYYRGHSHTAVSPDGVRWTPASSAEGAFRSGDTMTFTQNPVTGEYLAYHKRSGGEGRKVWLTCSSDFKTWSGPELIFEADETDNAWTTKPGQRAEIYDMSVLPHAAGFVGFPAVFRIETVTEKSKLVPRQSGHDGPIDIQLAASCDGRTWRRSTPRTSMIPRGEHAEYDKGVLLGLTNSAVHTERETWMYYTAINTGHGAPMPPKRVTIGRAEWRRHGFVSLDAGPAGGRIKTAPLRFVAPVLIINADAHRGSLRVALHEADGRAIDGFGINDCDPLQNDDTQWKVRWNTTAPIPTNRPVRVVIECTNTRIFSLSNQ